MLSQRDAAVQKVSNANAQIIENKNIIFKAQQNLTAINTPGIVGPKVHKEQQTSSNKTPPKPSKFSYIYNAPLISATNFKGLQAEVLGGNFITSGNYTDALQAFKIDKKSGNIMVGRGTFQADRITRTAIISGQLDKTNNIQTVDPNLYGFKFLYNPQTVTMSWGSIAMTDPVFQASGKDPFLPATSNLMASTVEFSILLNRIEDMSYLNKSGLKPAVSGNLSNTAFADRQNTLAQNPYPQFGLVPGKRLNEELAEIYEEGTMYDLKYLFRAMHAGGVYAAFKNNLMNTVTADPGFLPVRPIELHLGNSLRYRVRIASLSVNHTIFNARMIPVLTTVNISCMRYYDGFGNRTNS